MPKNRALRAIDLRPGGSSSGSAVAVSGGGGGTTTVTDHGALTGLADDDHTQYHNDARGDARYALIGRNLIAGAGLTGGGTLAADRTFAVGAGLGITVNADDVALASSVAGAGLTYSSGVLAVGVSGLGLGVGADAVTLTSSSAPGAAASILASDSSGALALQHLIAVNYVRTPQVNTNSGNLVLDAAGDQITVNPSNNLRTSNYASQLTGWALDYNGSLDARYIYTDEMHAKSFIADLEQALAGGQIISKSVAVLAANFTCPAAGASDWLYVESLPSADGMDVFEAGDMIRLRQFSRAGGSLTIADCWGTVRKNAGEPIYATDADGKETQGWHFTRSTATSGRAGTATGTIQAGTLALDYGASGNGFYEVNAIDGANAANSPYLQFVKWTTHPKDGSSLALRLGNLTGISGRSANEYGLVYGDTTSTSAASAVLSTAASEFRNLDMKWYSGGSVFASVDSGGFDIVTTTTVAWERSYTLSNGSGAYGGLRGYSNPSGGDGNYLQLYATTTGSLSPRCHVVADGTATYPGSVYIAANGVGTAGVAYFSMIGAVTTLSDAIVRIGDGAFTTAVQLNGATTISSTLGVGGNVTMTGASPTLIVGSSNVTTGDTAIGIGSNRTGNGNAYLDLRGDTTYSYAVRLIRGNTGANATTSLIHRGTGNLEVIAEHAANIRFHTGNTPKVAIEADGDVDIVETVRAKAILLDQTATYSGTTGTTTFTGEAYSGALSTGAGTIKLTNTNNTTNAGFVKAYLGTTVIWLPYFTTIAP
jgi:hypothetical protein